MLDYEAIPEQIKDKMKTIELTVDVIFVNNIAFLIPLGKIWNLPQSKCGGLESGYPIKSPL